MASQSMYFLARSKNRAARVRAVLRLQRRKGDGKGSPVLHQSDPSYGQLLDLGRGRGAGRLTLGGVSNTACKSFIRFELPLTLNVPSTSVAFSFKYLPLLHLISVRGGKSGAEKGGGNGPSSDDGGHDAPDVKGPVWPWGGDGDTGVGDGFVQRPSEDGSGGGGARVRGGT